MRTREARTETWHGIVTAGQDASGPGWRAMNLGTGGFDIRVTDSRYRLVGVTPISDAQAGEAHISERGLSETPQRVRLLYTTSSGATGSYGGAFALHVERKFT